MKKIIKKELIKLSTGEFASVFAFWLCYFLWFKEHTIHVVYPLSVLCFLLMQGSTYWFICLIRVTQKNMLFKRIGKFYLALKYIDMLLLLGYIPILLISPTVTLKYYFWGIFLILFAFIEFINYFLFRLSYKNVSILISQIRTGSLRKSKLAKEIEFSRL